MSESREAQREAGKGMLGALGAGGAGQAGWSLARAIKTQIFGKELLNLPKGSWDKGSFREGQGNYMAGPQRLQGGRRAVAGLHGNCTGNGWGILYPRRQQGDAGVWREGCCPSGGL